jgi:hypothetical protein
MISENLDYGRLALIWVSQVMLKTLAMMASG